MLKDRVFKRMLKKESKEIKKYIKEREWALLENGYSKEIIEESMIETVKNHFNKEGFDVVIEYFGKDKYIKITLPEDCFNKQGG